MKIYVGNLSFQTTEDELQHLFADFGTVTAVKIISDNYTKRSRGFGFVEMTEQADGESAIQKLNSTSFQQQVLVVNEARPTSDRRENYSGRSFNKRY